MKNLDRIFSVATRVRTPMSVVSLTLIVLYLVLRQFLSMDVFSNVGDNRTYLLLDKVLDRIFLLSIVTLVLGLSAYLFVFLVKRKRYIKSSNVVLIDARSDEALSDYEQSVDNDSVKISRKKKDDKD